MKKIDLLIIDPQNDFCDPNGSLFVNGADKDSIRLANMIKRLKGSWNDIHVTMDSHHVLDIAHPLMWLDEHGNHPTPFTLISKEDVEHSKFRPINPAWHDRVLDYVKSLSTNNRYALVVWPEHCIIGSWGYGIVSPVFNALMDWERENVAMVDLVTKGSNFWTEHYSAVMADVPDPADPSTQLNTKLIQTLQSVDLIAITGQALSHCVANTVRDIANNFGEENIKKLVLIEDTTSNVAGFESMGQDFVKEMVARGMQIARSDTFLV